MIPGSQPVLLLVGLLLLASAASLRLFKRRFTWATPCCGRCGYPCDNRQSGPCTECGAALTVATVSPGMRAVQPRFRRIQLVLGFAGVAVVSVWALNTELRKSGVTVKRGVYEVIHTNGVVNRLWVECEHPVPDFASVESAPNRVLLSVEQSVGDTLRFVAIERDGDVLISDHSSRDIGVGRDGIDSTLSQAVPPLNEAERQLFAEIAWLFAEGVSLPLRPDAEIAVGWRERVDEWEDPLIDDPAIKRCKWKDDERSIVHSHMPVGWTKAAVVMMLGIPVVLFGIAGGRRVLDGASQARV